MHEKTCSDRKIPLKIRDDAIRMAIKKASTGCISCADGYFALARTNGASQADIAAAIAVPEKSGLGMLRRRQLLRLAAGGAGALALSGLLSRPRSADATCGPPYDKYTGTTYWGSHLFTHYLPGKPPQQFYAYRAGYETTASPYGFDQTGANGAGLNSTYQYWDLWGANPSQATPPNIDYPTYAAAYGWGQAQASAAVNAWWGGTYAPCTYGNVIFGTIVPTAPADSTHPKGAQINGWTPDNTGTLSPWAAQNRWVLEGWLDGVSSAYSLVGYFTNGLYTGPQDWDSAVGPGTYFGGGSRAFVLWLAPKCWAACRNDGTYTLPCHPCDTNCDTTECDVEVAMVGAVEAAVGGYQTVIWHYWNECHSTPGVTFPPPDCSQVVNGKTEYPDYDVAVKDPNNNGFGFVPKAYVSDPNCPTCPQYTSYPANRENCCGGCACNVFSIC